MTSADRTAGVTASNAPLRIVHVLPHVGSAQGGPVVALAMLATQQVAGGHSVTVVASTLEQDGPPVRLVDGIELIEEPASRALG